MSTPNTVVTFPVPPKKISAGAYQSACIGNIAPEGSLRGPLTNVEPDGQLHEHDSAVYVWGRNKWNLCGQPEAKTELHSASEALLDRKGLSKAGDVGVYEVACGDNHTIVLVKPASQPGGQLYGFGLKNRGRIGVPADSQDEVQDLTKTERPVRIKLPMKGVLVLRVVVGSDHSLCYTTSGALFAWGINNEGQCGVGHLADVTRPQKVLFDRPVGHFAAGSRHSLLVTGAEGKTSGVLFAWGCGGQGRLGLGHTRSVHTPERVEAMEKPLTRVACGEAHSGAVDSERRLHTWGAGSHGRLGLSEDLDVPTPREVMMLSDEGVQSIALGAFHSVCLSSRSGKLDNQKLFTWGVGAALGLLDEGDNSVVQVPRQVPIQNFVSSSVDGEGKRVDAGGITQITCGSYHTMCLWESGDIMVFGLGSCGRLGTGKSKAHWRPVSVKGRPGFCTVFHMKDAVTQQPKMIKCDFYHKSEKSKLKNETGDNEDEEKEPWMLKQLGLGAAHSVALTLGGALYTWGLGQGGRLGHGIDVIEEKPKDEWIPRWVKMPERRAVERIAVGFEFTLVMCSFRDAWAWGRGDKGQLGTGRSKDTFEPTQVATLRDCIFIAAGEEHGAAICKSGAAPSRLYTWGSGEIGKLGVGQEYGTQECPTPLEVKGKPGTGFGITGNDENDLKNNPVFVACGPNHTVVICGEYTDKQKNGEGLAGLGCGPGDNNFPKGGSVWTMGSGWYGRLGLGDGVTRPRYNPNEVTEMEVPAQFVACGTDHTVAVEYDVERTYECGYLWVWGKGRMVCEQEDCMTPKKFSYIEGRVLSVACSASHTICVTDANEVMAWGNNTSGQLGLGRLARSDVFMPEPMRTLPGEVKIVACGLTHGMAFLDNKESYGWGAQGCGRLGLPDRTADAICLEPRKVKSQWMSIEAMAGGSESGEEDGSGHSSTDEDKEEEPMNEAEALEQRKANERMLKAILDGQKVQKFATMQTLLKHEPEAAKEKKLREQEKALNEKFAKFAEDVAHLQAKENVVTRLQADLEQSFCSNLKHIKRQIPPDFGNAFDGAVFSKVSSKMGYYEELLWILQQQASYLGGLCMCLEGEAEREKTYYAICKCVYAELTNDRVLHLFMAMMKIMIAKEVEHAKDVYHLFVHTDSRFFHVFGSFALESIHYTKVVHAIMDCTIPSDTYPTGVERKGTSSLIRYVQEATHAFQLFCLDTKDFKKAMLEEKGTELTGQELTVEFNTSVDKFREFVHELMLPCLIRVDLHENVRRMMNAAVTKINDRQFQIDEEEDKTVSPELKVYLPLLSLYVLGVLVPMLKAPEEYASVKVFLAKGKEGKMVAEDPAIASNLGRLAKFLELMMKKDGFSGKEQKNLGILAKTVKLELLKYMRDQATLLDDTYTRLTVDAYVAHYDRSMHIISAPTSQLLKLSNLLRQHESKLRVSEDDAVAAICKKIGTWTPDVIQSVEQQDQVHNFHVNARFLFTDKQMTVCRISHCPVPPRLSSTSGGKAKEEFSAIQTYAPENSDVAYTVLEDLFYEIQPLDATDFNTLKSELEDLVTSCTSKQPPNFTLAHRLTQGLERIVELKNMEVTPADVLRVMSQAVIDRDAHRAYLESVDKGIHEIEKYQKLWDEELTKADKEMRAALRFSMKLRLPKKILDKAGDSCKFKIVSNHIERVSEVGRSDLPGVSYVPMKTFSLKRLQKDRVIVEVCGDLRPLSSRAEVTFSLGESGTGVGIRITVQPKRGSKKTLKSIKIPEETIRELRRADEADTLNLPLDEPEAARLVVCSSAKLTLLLSNLSTGL